MYIYERHIIVIFVSLLSWHFKPLRAQYKKNPITIGIDPEHCFRNSVSSFYQTQVWLEGYTVIVRFTIYVFDVDVLARHLRLSKFNLWDLYGIVLISPDWNSWRRPLLGWTSYRMWIEAQFHCADHMQNPVLGLCFWRSRYLWEIVGWLHCIIP